MQKCSGQANETETLGVGSIKLSTSGVSERMFIPSCSPFWQSFSAVFGEGGRSIRLASCLLLAPPAQDQGSPWQVRRSILQEVTLSHVEYVKTPILQR